MASRTRQPRGSGQREEKEGEEGGRQGKGEQRGEGRGKGGGKGGGEGGRTCESQLDLSKGGTPTLQGLGS